MSARALAFGPGLAPEVSGRGLIVSAHRDSHFAWLREVGVGDQLLFERDKPADASLKKALLGG